MKMRMVVRVMVRMIEEDGADEVVDDDGIEEDGADGVEEDDDDGIEEDSDDGVEEDSDIYDSDLENELFFDFGHHREVSPGVYEYGGEEDGGDVDGNLDYSDDGVEEDGGDRVYKFFVHNIGFYTINT